MAKFVPDFRKTNPYEGVPDEYLERIKGTQAYETAVRAGYIQPTQQQAQTTTTTPSSQVETIQVGVNKTSGPELISKTDADRIKAESPTLYDLLEKKGVSAYNVAINQINRESDQKTRLEDLKRMKLEDQARISQSKTYPNKSESLVGKGFGVKGQSVSSILSPAADMDQFRKEVQGPSEGTSQINPQLWPQLAKDYMKQEQKNFVEMEKNSLIGSIPVVGTVYFWDEMSPAWRGVSIAADALSIIPVGKVATLARAALATKIGGSARAIKSVETVINAGRAAERATIEAVSGKEVLNAFDKFNDAANAYAKNQANIKSIEKTIKAEEAAWGASREDYYWTLADLKKESQQLRDEAVNAGNEFGKAQMKASAKGKTTLSTTTTPEKTGIIGRPSYDMPGTINENFGRDAVKDIEATLDDALKDKIPSLKKLDKQYNEALAELEYASNNSDTANINKWGKQLMEIEQKQRVAMSGEIANLTIKRGQVYDEIQILKQSGNIDNKAQIAKLESQAVKLEKQAREALVNLEESVRWEQSTQSQGRKLSGGYVPEARSGKPKSSGIEFNTKLEDDQIKLLENKKQLKRSKDIPVKNTKENLKEAIKNVSDTQEHLNRLYRQLDKTQNLSRRQALEKAIRDTKKVLVKEKVKVRVEVARVIMPEEAGKYLPAVYDPKRALPAPVRKAASRQLARVTKNLKVGNKSIPIRELATRTLRQTAIKYGVSEKEIYISVSSTPLTTRTKQLIAISRPDIVTYPLTKTGKKFREITIPDVDTAVKTQTETKTATETKTRSATQTETKTATETKTRSATQTETKTATETKTRSATQTETKTATETKTLPKTAIKSNTSKKTKSDISLKTLPKILNNTTEDQKRRLIMLTPGSVTQNMGKLKHDGKLQDVWHTKVPGVDKPIVTFGAPPKGAFISVDGTGSAERTTQTIGNVNKFKPFVIHHGAVNSIISPSRIPKGATAKFVSNYRSRKIGKIYHTKMGNSTLLSRRPLNRRRR